MDALSPRTPSPPTTTTTGSPKSFKDGASADNVHIFSPEDDAGNGYGQWQQQQQPGPPSSRPSLLQELYDAPAADGLSPEHSSPPDMYVENDWPSPPANGRPDYTMVRRATLPYSRQERPDAYPPTSFLPPHGYDHQQHHQPMSAEPSALHGDYPSYDNGYHHHEQHQQGFYRGPPPMHHMHPHPHHAMQPLPHHHHPHPHAHMPMPMPPMPIHHPGYPPHGIQVQHTDDAASKETQYLRRRCFNCHTTEPPSWRRSTLNPGKIVCNKCGLYERTHLRPRPLRFDELRAGNKARKGGSKGAANGGGPSGSPKAPTLSPSLAKKSPGIVRRSSVSSTGSSTQSGSGASDWDDTVSVYSSNGASTPSTSFNSPHPPSLTLSAQSSSSTTSSPGRSSRSPPLLSSPPHSAGLPHPHNAIRLPHAPEIPGLLNGVAGLRTKPRSNTTGGVGMGMYHGPGSVSGSPHLSNAHLGSPHMQPHSPPTHPHTLHHSHSNSSLHSHSELSSSPEDGFGSGDLGGELYRRTSMPDMQQAWSQGHAHDDAYGYAGMGIGGMGGVKEEPRSVLV